MTDRPDLDRLAEIDAGLAVDPRAHAAAMADPASRAGLDALAATRAELAALPPVPVPRDLAARWRAALAAEAASSAAVDPPGAADPAHTAARPPGDHRFGAHAAAYGWERTEPTITPNQPPPGRPGPGRPPGHPPRRRRTPRPAIVVGLVLVAVLVVVGVVRARTAPPAVTAVELVASARAAVGVRDAGELTDPVRRAGCLRAVAPPGLAPDAPLFGGRGVVFEGRPGVLLVLGSGRLGTFRVVVVDPACGPAGGTLLADTRIGR